MHHKQDKLDQSIGFDLIRHNPNSLFHLNFLDTNLIAAALPLHLFPLILSETEINFHLLLYNLIFYPHFHHQADSGPFDQYGRELQLVKELDRILAQH